VTPERLTRMRFTSSSAASSRKPAANSRSRMASKSSVAKGKVDVVVIQAAGPEMARRMFGQVQLQARAAVEPYAFNGKGGSREARQSEDRLIEFGGPFRIDGHQSNVVQQNRHACLLCCLMRTRIDRAQQDGTRRNGQLPPAPAPPCSPSKPLLDTTMVVH